MATLQEFIDDLTFLVGDNTSFWVEAEKIFAANESIAVWQVFTGEFPGTSTTPVTGDIYYNVPRQLVSLTGVLHDGVPLTQASLTELDYGSPGWEGEVGTPVYWTPIGLNMVAITPAPTTGNLFFEGIKDGPRLSSAMDTITFIDNVSNDLEGYGHHYLVFKEGGQEFKATHDGLKEFARAAGERNQELLSTNFYKAYTGRQRDQELRPQRSGEASIGMRT